MNTTKSLSYYLSRIEPQRITAARELRGLTRKALADIIGKSPAAISLFESGKSGLDPATFAKLTLALSMPPAFFTSDNPTSPVDFSTCHFRANRSLSQSDRRKAFQFALCYISLFSALESFGVSFPNVQLDPLPWNGYNGHYIEKAAVDVRKSWGLGNGPISNVAGLLESKGIFVLFLPDAYEKMDAFSMWVAERPCIVISKGKEPSRIQFDYAHELAHLVFHMDESAGDPESERAANHFAGAFLAPYETFSTECPTRWNYHAFLNIKSRWRMSIAASLYRAKQIGKISENSYKSGMIALRDNRRHEVGEFSPSMPSMIKSAIDLIKEDVSLDALADRMCITTDFLKEILLCQGVSESTLIQMSRKTASALPPLVFRNLEPA